MHIARPDVTIQEGIAIAAGVIDSGKALTRLEEFISMSRNAGAAL
jgi:anthranilate phosphoribosyltransferase